MLYDFIGKSIGKPVLLKIGSNGLSLRGLDILIFGTEMKKRNYILKWLIHSHNDEIAEYTHSYIIIYIYIYMFT